MAVGEMVAVVVVIVVVLEPEPRTVVVRTVVARGTVLVTVDVLLAVGALVGVLLTGRVVVDGFMSNGRMRVMVLF